jgi:hypothetical protein
MYTYISLSFENRTVCELLRKKIVEPDRAQMGISHMRNECCITKAKCIHRKYVILIHFLLQ